MPPEAQGQPQGGGQAQGAEQQGQQQQQGQGQAGQQGQEEPFDKDRAMATIQAQRASEKALKDQIATLTAKVTEFEQAGQTETEKLTGKIADYERNQTALQRDLQEARVESAFTTAAQAAGARYPSDVWRLVDMAAVTFDDSGRPTNLKALIDQIRKDRPDYFRPQGGNGSADGGVRSTPPGSVDKNEMMRSFLRGGRST